MKTFLRGARWLSVLIFAGSSLAALAANTATVTPSVTSYSAAGGNITFSVSLGYTASLSALDMRVVTPTGWKYVSTAGVNQPETRPAADDLGSFGFDFIYSAVPAPAAPLTFTFTVNYPAGMTGTKSITGIQVNFTDEVTSVASTVNVPSINIAPALSAVQAIASQALTAGSAAPAFTPVTAANGSGPYTWAVNPALPAALTLNVNTGQITGTPAALLAATTYTITITDATTTTATNTFSLTVNSALVTSVTTATKALTINTAAASFIPVTASAGTSPYTYSVAPSLPTGLALNASTGAVSGTPSVAAASTTYTVTATDAVGATSSKTFTLVVNPALVASQVGSARTLTAGNGAASSFVPVVGSGGTTGYTYSIAPALPSALVFNTSTGSVSGTPAAPQSATTYTVTITDAAGAAASNTFSLAINPVIAAAQAVATKGLTLGTAATSFIPVAVSGGTAPFTHTIAPALPGGISLAFASGAITGTPSATAAAANYTVTITDVNGAQASNTFNLTVNAALASTQAVATKSLTLNSAAIAFTPVTITGGTAPVVYSVNPALPTGLTLSTSNGSVTGTPSVTAAAADYTVTITDAAGATTSKTFNLTVNGALVATQAVPSRTLTAGSAATAFTPVTASGGTTAYVFSVAPALPTGLAISPTTGAISGTPSAAAALQTYTVTVTDAAGATATATFTLDVNGPVSATQLIATKSLTVGAAANFSPVSGAGGTAPYTYTIAPALPVTLSLNANTGAITGTPSVAATAVTYTVTVRDSTNATATANFSLTINAAVIANQTVATKALTAGTAAVSFIPVTGSAGTTPYVYSVSPVLPATLSLNAATGAITGTPSAAATAAPFTVTVTDAAGATATNTFNLTVNVALAAGSTLTSRTLTAGSIAASFTPLSLTGGTTPYIWSVSPALPAALVIAPGSGAITGTPSAALTSTNFTVTGTDAAGAQVSQAFALVINPALGTAQAVATTTLTANTAATAFTPVTASGGTAPYVFSVAPALPNGLALNTATGQVTGTPTAASGLTTYTVTVTDNVGATSTKTFALTVNGPLAANQAIAAKSLSATTAAIAFTPVTAGGGTQPYSFSIAPALPSSLTISATTGAITGTPAAASPATIYTVTVTDAASGSASATFTLTVNAALATTQIVAAKALTVGTPAMTFAPVTAAFGTTPYVFTVAPTLPNGLTLDSATGAISGTPTAVAATATYTVTVTDAANAVSTKTLGLTVNATPTPVAGQTISSKTLTATTAAVAFTPLPLNGGTLPFLYTVTPDLPTGLVLNPVTGAITGTPAATTPSAVYTITAVDSAGASVTQALTLAVNPPLVATQAVASKVILVNVAATAFTPVTIAGGTAPFLYTIAPALPTGLSIVSGTGAISGTPTVTAAQVTHTVTITDAVGATANATFTLRVDRAAAITTQPLANASYLVGAPLTLTVVATGSPAPTYLWRKGGTDLPGKTASTLVFAALALTDAGSYDVVVTNDAGTVTSTAVSFLVYLPPSITTQPANQTIVAGQNASFTIVATGDPTPTYQWRRNGLNISGATSATLNLTNVPFDGGGSFSVALSNPGGSIVSSAATLTVNPIAPVITSPDTATGILGRLFQYQVTATTTQATYTATGLPGGLTLNSSTGVLSGTPTATGVFPASLTATNVTGSNTKTVTITIQSPPPIINSAAAASGRVGVAFSFAVQAVNMPGGSTYAASGLPAGLAIASATGVISGTPTASGVFSVVLTATNTTGSTTSPLQLTIDPPLNAPTFAGSTNLSAKQGVAFSFSPAFGGAPFTGSFFTATGLPTGITLSSATASAATLSGTPTATGTFSVVVTATNAGGSLAVTFNLTVNPADAAPVITSASTATATVGSVFNFTLTASGSPTAFTATGLPGTLTLTPGSGLISGTPTAAGTFTVQVGAANGTITGPQSVLVIQINPAANAPVITSASVVQGRVGDALTYNLAASNSPTGYLITSGTLPAGLTHTAGVVSGTPTQVGTQRVWFAAVAGAVQGLSLEILFNIAPAPTTPVITSNGTAAGQAGQPFSYVIAATNTPTGFTATGLPSGLTLAGGASGVISGIPLAATTTPLSVILTATNGSGTSTPKTLLLTIAPAPATPVITSALTANGRVGSVFSYTVTASEDATSFVADNLARGLTLNPTTGVISGTPTQSGSISTTLRAGNAAGLGAQSTLVLNIVPAPLAPAITSAASATGKVGAVAAFSYQTVATPGPITGYGITGTLPLGLSFNTSTGAITGRPAQSGLFTVEITATSDGGTSAPQSLVLNIAPADNAPVITSGIYAYGTVGAPFSYQITAAGTPVFPSSPFPAPFTLEAVNLPAGLAVNPSTGLIEGLPTAAGTFTATLVATNSAGAGPFRDLTIVIQPSATAPVITSVLTGAAQVGTSFAYQIAATQNPTSYEVLDAPSWMTVNSVTGAIAGTPTAPGTISVRLFASNASGASSPATLVLTVASSPNAPVVTSSRVATGKVSSTFAYQITALVPTSAPAVTAYVATGLPNGLTLNDDTGAITGTPLASGQFEVTLIAKSSAGDSQPVKLILTIQPNVTFVF